MNSALTVGGVGLLSCGLGLFFGGLLALVLKDAMRRSIPSIFSICAGLIVGLVIFELLPTSVQNGGWVLTITGLTGSAILFRFLHKLSQRVIVFTNDQKKDLFLHAGLVLGVNIALHNLPSGFVLGASSDARLTRSLISALVLHHIPEGMAMFTPLSLVGMNITGLFMVSLVMAMPIGMGAIIGGLISWHLPGLFAVITGIAAGNIFLVSVKELFSQALKIGNRVLCMLLFFAGYLIIWLYLFIV